MATLTRNILVTGANRGLGLALCERLLGLATPVTRVHLTIACRDTAAGQQAAAQLLTAAANAEHVQVTVRRLDVADPASISELVAELEATREPLHLLVNNAGVYPTGKTRKVVNVAVPSADENEIAIENTFLTNYLGAASLTLRLLPLLRRSASADGTTAEIVMVGSELYKYAPPGPICLPMLTDAGGVVAGVDEASFSAQNAYAVSKLAMMQFTHYLHKHVLPEHASQPSRGVVTINACTPGFVPATNMAGKSKVWYERIVSTYLLPLLPFARTIDQGADSLLACCRLNEPAADGPNDDHKELISGAYVKDGKVVATSPRSQDEKEARRLWEWTIAVLGIQGVDS
ncbi:Retinol dehydrogenase 14 [Geranomyces variabilis]|uniref:Retinol dehydrogenase 14 n=1 Tax=Geranomyces variabilis TaxID=109894 RepID=A0AAD5TDF0_9FUNG|nr:Retinol dehydrogenase 14 [Geranomyces variabilis]